MGQIILIKKTISLKEAFFAFVFHNCVQVKSVYNIVWMIICEIKLFVLGIYSLKVLFQQTQSRAFLSSLPSFLVEFNGY